MNANIVAALGCWLMGASVALAQGDLLGTDEMAEAIVAMAAPTWRGPRVPYPTPLSRPDAHWLAESSTAPVVVHGDETSQAKVDRALVALEHAYHTLRAERWPVWATDGALGGGPGWDLYLVNAEHPTRAYTDAQRVWSYRDKVSTYAVMDSSLPLDAVAACATDAFVRAMLFAHDPAEARSWRAATAAWLTWRLTGAFGCQDIGAQKALDASKGWVQPDQGAAGGVMLAMISARHDGGRGDFVRFTWDLATQRTWEGQGLRADPDLWSAFEVSLKLVGSSLTETMVDLATARYFLGRPSAFSEVTSTLNPNERLIYTYTGTQLPFKVSGAAPLDVFGSSYVTSPQLEPSETKALHVWLRGEYGVSWSLVLVQLDQSGANVGQVSAAPTKGAPRAFIPVQLDARTERVLAVVTNLSSRRPDADEPDANQRSFEVIMAAEP